MALIIASLVVFMYFVIFHFQLDSSYDTPDLRKDNEVKAPDLRMELIRSSVYTELLAMRVVPIPPGKCEASAPEANAYGAWWVTPHQSQCLSLKFCSDALKLTFTKQLCTDNEVRFWSTLYGFVVSSCATMLFLFSATPSHMHILPQEWSSPIKVS